MPRRRLGYDVIRSFPAEWCATRCSQALRTHPQLHSQLNSRFDPLHSKYALHRLAIYFTRTFAELRDINRETFHLSLLAVGAPKPTFICSAPRSCSCPNVECRKCAFLAPALVKEVVQSFSRGPIWPCPPICHSVPSFVTHASLLSPAVLSRQIHCATRAP